MYKLYPIVTQNYINKYETLSKLKSKTNENFDNRIYHKLIHQTKNNMKYYYFPILNLKDVGYTETDLKVKKSIFEHIAFYNNKMSHFTQNLVDSKFKNMSIEERSHHKKEISDSYIINFYENFVNKNNDFNVYECESDNNYIQLKNTQYQELPHRIRHSVDEVINLSVMSVQFIESVFNTGSTILKDSDTPLEFNFLTTDNDKPYNFDLYSNIKIKNLNDKITLNEFLLNDEDKFYTLNHTQQFDYDTFSNLKYTCNFITLFFQII